MPALNRPVAIVGGNRIPFAKAGGAYAKATTQDMLTATLDGLAARFGLASEAVGLVGGGAVLKSPSDWNLTRESVLGSCLSPTTPCFDLQQACATSLQTSAVVAAKIAAGEIDSGIGCGVDSASDVPISVDEDLRALLLDLNRARTTRQRLALLPRLRPGQLRPRPPRTTEARTGMSMGEHAAITAQAWGLSRTAQDELAAASHHNLAAGYDNGFYDDLVTP